MAYLLTQIFLYMFATFLLGLLLGWLLWRYGRTETVGMDTSELDAKLAAMHAERDDYAKQFTQEREAASVLRGENESLKSQLAACEARVAGQDSAPPAAVQSGEASQPAGLTGPRNGVADELQKISGVGPKLEGLLHKLGFYHFDQIADWTEAEVAWVDENLEGFSGRVTRDEWIRQAKELAKG